MDETSDVTGVDSPWLKRKREAGRSELNDSESEETESMSELLNLLDDSTTETTMSTFSYTSSTMSYGMRVKFSNNPYSSALIFQSSSSYVTINGNEESCGSSFSESESSVMASVDMGGILSKNVEVGGGLEGIIEWLEAEENGAWWENEEEARGWVVDSELEWDEEETEKFLGVGLESVSSCEFFV